MRAAGQAELRRSVGPGQALGPALVLVPVRVRVLEAVLSPAVATDPLLAKDH